jgi:hypothetical protein
LYAFFASGAIWIAGTSIGLRPGIPLEGVAAAYVVIGALALAVAGTRPAATLVWLWGCAAALIGMVAVPVAGPMAIVIGILFGTLCFGAWACTGFVLLHFFSPSRRPVRTADQGARPSGG